MQVNKEPQFLRSDFMGSLALLDNGSYLVNVPTVQKLPMEKVPGWIAAGVFADSILNYIYLLGSDIFLMDANDQLVAKYWSDSANFVYNNFILDLSTWPQLLCAEDSVASTSYPANFIWQDEQQFDLGTNAKQPADESKYRLAFPFGIFDAYSSVFDSKVCITTNINNELVLKDFYIYPNPSQTFLNFSKATDRYVIFDFLGRFVKSGEGSIVDVSNLDNGVYLINLLVEGIQLSSKFSKY
jgi:hypothetical protein